MKLKFQGSQKKPTRVTISQKGLGKKFQKIHLSDHQYLKVNGVVTLFTVANFRPVSTSSTHVGNLNHSRGFWCQNSVQSWDAVRVSKVAETL